MRLSEDVAPRRDASPGHPRARAEIELGGGIAEDLRVPPIQHVLDHGHQRHPIMDPIVRAQVQLLIARIQIAIRQEHRRTEEGVRQEGARVAAADDTAPGPVRECWLTHIDGYGNQLVLIAREGEGGRYDAALFTLSEREGIPECFSARGLTPRDYRSVVALMRRETPLVPISYEEARTLVRDALFIARRHRAFICPEFAFRRRIFGDDDLSPKEYRPEFPDFLLAEVRRQYAELLATSDRLLTVFPFSEWWMDTPTAREFITRRKLEATSLRLTREIVLAFIEEVIEPERETLVRRFALTAEFLLHLIGGRAPRSTYPWKATLALWKALRDRRRSLSKIPFFHELARVTIAGLAANIGRDENPSRESHP